MSRSMGLHDFYPFVLSRAAVRKLYFVHQVIDGARAIESEGRAGSALEA
jgi:hypothetical protein